MRLHRTLAPARRHSWRAASVATAGVLALGWVSGCSVLYDLSTEQCKQDTDCVALGDAFESLVCIDNLCQAPPLTGCQSNAQCMDEQTSGVDAWACIDTVCQPLITPECPTMLPQTNELWRDILRSDDPLILAGTGVIGGTQFMDVNLRNYDLALTELENINSGLPSTRKVMMIGCQAAFDEDEEALEREMQHLANVVKVPGIVSTYFAADLQRAFNEYGKAAQMFFMSALESDPTLAALQDDGLIWHIGPNFDVVARAYAPLLKRTLAHLGVSTGAKVATVVTTDARLLANMVATVESTPDKYGLSFNGMSVTQNRPGNYVRFNIASGDASQVSTQVAAILALEPHVIVSIADTQFVQRMIPAIESGWPASGPPKPFYLLSPFNFNDGGLQEVLEMNSSLASRIAGVNAAAAANTDVYDRYIGRYEAAFPEFAGAERGYENFYDAAYYLLYAAAGAGENLANGRSLLAGMNRLLSGLGPFDVGPEQMPNAMAALRVGNATIQLNGTLGPPDWNTADGTRDAAGSVWCIDSGRAFHPDVLRYVPNADPTQATLSGSMPCIPGF